MFCWRCNSEAAERVQIALNEPGERDTLTAMMMMAGKSLRSPHHHGGLTMNSSIGELPPTKHRQLCSLLNIHDIWKDLACVIQNRTKTAPRFTHDDILYAYVHANYTTSYTDLQLL